MFAAAWGDTHRLSADAERRPAAEASAEGAGEQVRIVSNNRRLVQRRRLRHVRFDTERKGILLAASAQSCDLIAAAAAAGICERTVRYHLRSDPAFAEAFQAALEEGYRRLEAESVRERIQAQQRIRAAMEAAEAAGEPLPVAAEGAEFDRTIKLLARWDRRDRAARLPDGEARSPAGLDVRGGDRRARQEAGRIGPPRGAPAGGPQRVRGSVAPASRA